MLLPLLGLVAVTGAAASAEVRARRIHEIRNRLQLRAEATQSDVASRLRYLLDAYGDRGPTVVFILLYNLAQNWRDFNPHRFDLERRLHPIGACRYDGYTVRVIDRTDWGPITVERPGEPRTVLPVGLRPNLVLILETMAGVHHPLERYFTVFARWLLELPDGVRAILNPNRALRLPFDDLEGLYNSGMVDWIEATEPNLSVLTLQEAKTQSEAWHAQFQSQAIPAEGATLPGIVVARFPDGSTVHRLVTSDQLEAEGQVMGHCVGGYDARDETQVILSLRDSQGKSFETVEINVDAHKVGPPSLAQRKGPNNREVSGGVFGELLEGLLLSQVTSEITPFVLVPLDDAKATETKIAFDSAAEAFRSARYADEAHLGEPLSSLWIMSLSPVKVRWNDQDIETTIRTTVADWPVFYGANAVAQAWVDVCSAAEEYALAVLGLVHPPFKSGGKWDRTSYASFPGELNARAALNRPSWRGMVQTFSLQLRASGMGGFTHALVLLEDRQPGALVWMLAVHVDRPSNASLDAENQVRAPGPSETLPDAGLDGDLRTLLLAMDVAVTSQAEKDQREAKAAAAQADRVRAMNEHLVFPVSTLLAPRSMFITEALSRGMWPFGQRIPRQPR